MMRLLLSIGELLPISFGISWDLKFVFALARNLFWWIDLCVCVCLLYTIYYYTIFVSRKKKARSKAFSRSLFFSCP
jgi:hypothetical protein